MSHPFSGAVKPSSKRVKRAACDWCAAHHQLERGPVQQFDQIAERRNPLINVREVRVVRLQLHANRGFRLIAVSRRTHESILDSRNDKVNLRTRVVTLDERKSEQTLARKSRIVHT